MHQTPAFILVHAVTLSSDAVNMVTLNTSKIISVRKYKHYGWIELADEEYVPTKETFEELAEMLTGCRP